MWWFVFVVVVVVLVPKPQSRTSLLKYRLGISNGFLDKTADMLWKRLL